MDVMRFLLDGASYRQRSFIETRKEVHNEKGVCKSRTGSETTGNIIDVTAETELYGDRLVSLRYTDDRDR